MPDDKNRASKGGDAKEAEPTRGALDQADGCPYDDGNPHWGACFPNPMGSQMSWPAKP